MWENRGVNTTIEGEKAAAGKAETNPEVSGSRVQVSGKKAKAESETGEGREGKGEGGTEADMECGGKRSATPLSNQTSQLASDTKALSADDRRQPSSASAVQNDSGGRKSRARLLAILEEYGVSVHGFDGLRADAYEKHLAGRSLAELEAFYGRLWNLTEGCEEIQQQCLPWGEGSQHKGKLPSVRTLREIKERIRLERKLTDMSGHLKAFQAVVASLPGLPVAERAVILQGLQALIAAELMGLSIEGGKVIDHLPAVDRVIRAASAQARGENMEAKARIAEKTLEFKNKELEFKKEQANAQAEAERQKAETDKAEAEERRKNEELKEAADREAREASEREAAAYDPVAEKAKTRAWIDKIYGLPPRPEAGTDKKNSNDEARMTNGGNTIPTSHDGHG